MIPQYQKVIDKDHGDCTVACIATITGIPLDEIPNDHDNFYLPIIEALDKRGWRYIEMGQKLYFWVFASLPGVPVIASVPSQAFQDRTHSIVVRVHNDRLEVVHDPNPNNEPYDIEHTEIKGWSMLIRQEGLPRGEIQNVPDRPDTLKAASRNNQEVTNLQAQLAVACEALKAVEAQRASLTRAGIACIELFKSWEAGVFKKLGIKWSELPPAFLAMEHAIKTPPSETEEGHQEQEKR